MSELPKISDAEWAVMKVVWSSDAPIAAVSIIAELNKQVRWHPRTVKTLLNRLVKKGAVRFKKEGREYLYRANVSEDACVRGESESFLQRVFGGALHPVLVQLVQERRMTPEEIKELKRILNAKEKE